MDVSIFVAYFVISCIVASVYVKHRRLIDTGLNRVLLVSAGLFLMLCALTHLHFALRERPSEVLLSLCAFVSVLAAVLTLSSFRGLDDYLALRLTAKDILREDVIDKLMDGYDLRVDVVGTEIVRGTAGAVEISEPLDVPGGFQRDKVVSIAGQHFRVANIIMSSVNLRPLSSSQEEDGVRVSPRLVVFGYDVTAEVRAKDEMYAMNEMKVEFCRATAHHLRTPLGCLRGALECLADNKRPDVVEEAIAHFDVVNLILLQLMDVSGVSGAPDVLSPNVSPCDVRLLMSKAETVCRAMSAEGVSVSFFVGVGVPGFVSTDKSWIQQILLSLALTAAQHTPTNGTIAGHLEFELENAEAGAEAGELSIVFELVGACVPGDIFDVDFANHGTDLNPMRAVKVKVLALRGRYEVGTGAGGRPGITCLVVKIPVGVEAMMIHSSSYAKSKGPSNQKSILVVDDTPSVRKMMTRLLRDHGVQVAVNGAEGLEMMKARSFDVVLLDLMMPVMDGHECLKAFRDWEKKKADSEGGVFRDPQLIYCMSAVCSSEGEMDAGFDGVLPKPVNMGKLREVLSSLSAPRPPPVR